MAKGNGNLLLKNISGHIGKELVIKQYGNKTVIARYPNMPKHKPSKIKTVYENRFKDAIIYAKAILADKVLKAKYEAKLQPGQRVYNYAISEYLLEAKCKINKKS